MSFFEHKADFQPRTLAPNEANLKARSLGSGCSSTLRIEVHLQHIGCQPNDSAKPFAISLAELNFTCQMG
jgi:hypothetical protein